MLQSSILTYRSHLIPILLHSVIMMLKSSPEFILSKKDNFQENINITPFIFSNLEGTLSFRLIITGIITLCLIFGVGRIFITKKGVLELELFSNIFFPIQTYLTIWSLNNDILCAGEKVYFITLFIISLFIITLRLLFFDFRTDSDIVAKSCNKSYQLLTQTIMLFMSVGSFFFNEQSKTAILVILLIFTLTKSYILFSFITFQDPLIEYSTYLVQPFSWLSLMSIFLSVFYNLNGSLILSGYTCLIATNAFIQNSTIRLLIERKYSSFIEQFLKLSKNKNKQKAKQHQQSLIIYLSIVKLCLQLKNTTKKNEYFLHFSKQFFHNVHSSIQKLEHIEEKKDLSQKNNQTLSFDGSSIIKYSIESNVIKNKQLNYQNQHQYAEKYWSIIKELKQLQDDNYNNLCRFVCYSLPQISNAFQARAIYIYYLSHHEASEFNTKKGQSIFEKLQNQIDYKFVVEKTKNKKIEQVLLKQNFYNQEIFKLIGLTNDIGSFCLKSQMSYGSNYFQEFYQQTIHEQTLQDLFHSFIKIKKQLITIVGSSHSTMKSLLKNICQINKIKSKIFTIVNDSPHVESRQYVLQQYIVSKYILKLPLLARQKLVQLEKQSEPGKFIHKVSSKSFRGSAQSLQWNENNQNEAIMMVSAVKSKGSIIYGSNKFKQIMEIKQGLNLADNQRNQMLHINHLILPCWVDQHDQVMKNLMIYEKPYHHLGNKYHLKSTVLKNIYEIEFTMHFITCQKDDLVIVMDMRYLKLDYLLIKKNNEKIFLQNIPENERKRRNGTIFGKNNPLQKNLLICEQPNYGLKKNRKRYEEMIFGEKYEIVTEYKKEKDNNFLEAATTISDLSEQSCRLHSSVWNFQNDRDEKKKSMQKKLHHYRRKHFLFRKQYFAIILISLAVMIITVSLLGSLMQKLRAQTGKHKQFYEFKHNVQSEYFLTDLKSFNNFQMLFVPSNKNIRFSSTEKVEEFKKIWFKVFTEQIGYLRNRNKNIANNLQSFKNALDFDYKSLDQSMSTFAYHQQSYQVQYFTMLKALQLNQSYSIKQNTLSFPDPNILLNQGQKYRLKTFYKQNINIFNEYLQPGSVADSVIKSGDQIFFDEATLLSIYFSLIVVIFVFGVCVIAYLCTRYLNQLYRFVSSLFDFPQKTIKGLQNQLQDFKNFIDHSKKSTDPNPYRTINTCHSLSLRNRMYFVRKIQKDRQSKQIQMLSPVNSNWKLLFLIVLFISAFILILYGAYSQESNEMRLMNRYMDGTKELVQLTAKSVNVFSLLLDGIFSPQMPLNPKLPLFIDQIKHVNLLSAMEKISTDSIDLEKSLFTSWYDNDFVSVNSIDNQSESSDQSSKRTLMQTLKKSIHLYELVYNKLSLHSRESLALDSKLIVQMYKELSHSTQMIRQLFIKAKSDFFQTISNFNEYLIIGILLAVLFSAILVIWLYQNLYLKTRVFFQETMSFTTIKDLLLVPSLSFYLHEAERQTSYKDVFE